jgi:hypothetical protein
MQSVYLQRIMKKNAAKGYEKTNPIPERPKMNENLFATKVYENITTFGLRQNKPNQTQFLPQKTNIPTKKNSKNPNFPSIFEFLNSN